MNTKEIWLVQFQPQRGSEISKVRPAVIVNVNAVGVLPLRVVVPITEWKDRYNYADWMVKIRPNQTNGLNKVSAADCFQVKSVSTERFVVKSGNLEDKVYNDIRYGLKSVLGL